MISTECAFPSCHTNFMRCCRLIRMLHRFSDFGSSFSNIFPRGIRMSITLVAASIIPSFRSAMRPSSLDHRGTSSPKNKRRESSQFQDLMANRIIRIYNSPVKRDWYRIPELQHNLDNFHREYCCQETECKSIESQCYA